MDSNYLNEIKIAPEQCVTGFGRTVIVAPHADDESLGCGGVISLLRKYGQEVYIVLLSDGTLSHPNSKDFPAEKLRDLREKELLLAASKMDVQPENVIFCRFKDRSVPQESSEDFGDAVIKISKMLNVIDPQSIFVPWRRDPHPDHRAAYQIIKNAKSFNAKIFEYPVWLQELGDPEDAPNEAEVMPFRLDISSVIQMKLDAIAAHLSQTTPLISDDPEGFTLSEDMLNQFKVPYETFFISK